MSPSLVLPKLQLELLLLQYNVAITSIVDITIRVVTIAIYNVAITSIADITFRIDIGIAIFVLY